MSYVLLMTCSAVASTFAIRHLMYLKMEERIENEIQRVGGEFKKYVSDISPQKTQPIVRDPAMLFDSFIAREVKNDKYYVLITKDRVYQTQNRQLPPTFEIDRRRLDEWRKIDREEDGEIELSPTSIVYYQAIPLKMMDGSRGVFTILFDATGECEEIGQAVTIIIQVMSFFLSIVLILAAIQTAKIIRRMESLTSATRSIGDTNLTHRIPVNGNDEVTELAITFNEMLDRLQTSFNIQKDFFNHTGHELRTPLTIIRVNLELLSEDPIERQKTIALVTDELDRMNRYVNDMILLSKSERPDFLSLETICIESFTQEIFAKAIALGDRRWRLKNIGQGKFVGDRHRLTQALMNLAQNAVQQTQPGAKIRIGSELKDGTARFSVRDAGIGIDPRVHELIFDRFIRCPDARKRFENMGLGLAIVKTIAEAHGGRVVVVSKLNLGSKFTVVIPVDSPYY
jgi:signal transduction histidine kinase